MAATPGGDSVISVAVWACACVWLVGLSVQGRKFDITDGRHNISLGHRRGQSPYYSDVLIVHDNPHIRGSWLRVQSADVCYPRPILDPRRRFSITAANVTDGMPPGQGGYAFVTQGGLNWGKLCLHLKTQRGLGYNFTVNIWGYYID